MPLMVCMFLEGADDGDDSDEQVDIGMEDMSQEVEDDLGETQILILSNAYKSKGVRVQPSPSINTELLCSMRILEIEDII